MLAPLLLILSATALVSPVIIVRSRMSMRRIWTQGLLLVILGHLIVSSIVLTICPPTFFGSGWGVHPIFVGPLLITALPVTVWIPPEFIGSLGLFCYLLYLLNSLVWGIIVTEICYLVRRKQVREQQKRHQRVTNAIEKIMEDGVVTIPKGPRASHRGWDSRTGSRKARRGTRGVKNPGYHGTPWA